MKVVLILTTASLGINLALLISDRAAFPRQLLVDFRCFFASRDVAYMVVVQPEPEAHWYCTKIII